MSGTETALPAAWLGRPWRRSLAWLLFLGPFFFLSYGYANQFAARAGIEASIHYPWEEYIPFLPWTIVPYWSIDLLYGLSFLCCRTAWEVDRHAMRLLTAQVLAVGCFLAFPLRFAFTRPPVEGAFGTLFDVLASFDQPFNQAPSLHISLLVLIWIQFARLAWPPAAKAAVHAWALLIGASVLTTWQHHFIDVPTGLAAGFLCLWLWPDASHANPWAGSTTRGLERRRIAARYALAAGLLAASAFTLGGWATWLAWPAMSLLLVAVIYGWSGGAGFQKREGRHSVAVRALLAPYLWGAWLNSRWWTRGHPGADEIAGGVLLGRMPGHKELQAAGAAGLCDLCAELPAPPLPGHYHGRPWLDLVPPSAEELLAAAEAIESLRLRGRVWVACALGYSRSAAVVAVWLRLSGRVDAMDQAVAWVRTRRPQVVLQGTWLRVLQQVEDRCQRTP